MTFDNKGKVNTIIAATIDDSEDYKIFSMEDHFITADVYHFTGSSFLQDISTSVPIKLSLDKLSLSPAPTIAYLTLTDNDTIVSLPLIFPKLKGIEIVEGKITNPEVRDSFDTYYLLLTQ